MTGTDYDELIQAVFNSPTDDSPRLALADWFELNDQPKKAEFIRLQLQIAAKMGGFDQFSFAAVDMYLDPQNSESQDWKHELLSLISLQQQKFLEIGSSPPTWPAGASALTARFGDTYFTSSPDDYLRYIDDCTATVPDRGFLIGLVRRGFAERIACRWESFIYFESLLQGGDHLFRRVGPWFTQPLSVVDLVGEPPERSKASLVGETYRGGTLFGVYQFKFWPDIRFVAGRRKWNAAHPRMPLMVNLMSCGLVSRETAMRELDLQSS